MLCCLLSSAYIDSRPAGWRQAGLDRRGHNRQLVATELRAPAVPVHSAAHHQAEGTQAAVSGTTAREG